MKNYLIQVIYFISQIAFCLCQDEIISFVYNSAPYMQYDVASQNGSSNNIKVANLANIVVAAVGKAGIMVIDSELNSTTFASPDGQYIECIQVTSDANYIFIAMKNQIGVFQYNDQINLISTIDTNDVNLADLIFSQDEEVLFMFAQIKVIRWYDIRDKKNIKSAGEIIYDQMLFWKGQILGSYLYLAADQDGLLVFNIEKIINSNNQEMQINLKRIVRKQAISSFLELVIVNMNEYVFAIDKWNGIYILYSFTDLAIEGDNAEDINNSAIQMSKADLGANAGYTSTISLSSNSIYLYVGVRSRGILIYDISIPTQPKFFQQLQQTGQSISLRLSPRIKQNEDNIFDNQFIFYSNSVSIIVYKKQLPTLYNNIPNLFNLQLSKFLTEETVGTAATKWRCHVSSDNKYFYGAFDADTLIIYKINIPDQPSPQPMSIKLLYQFNDVKESMNPVSSLRQFGPDESIPFGYYVDTVQFSKDEKYMYFASSQYDYNVIAYKFEIIKNTNQEWTYQYVKGLKHNEVYYAEQFNISDDELHAVMSFDVGIVLVDLVQFEVLSQFNNVGVLGTCCGAVLSHDKLHALAVVRNVGLFIYDISDMTAPKLANSWRTNGGETLLRSQTEKIIYLNDGFNGLILLDSSKLPQIVVISQFQPSGWTNFISFTGNEQYGIISTMDTGMLTLIDLSDKTNPRLIMKSAIQDQDSQTSCLDSSSMKFGFSPNKNGVVYFEMQSMISIHVEREIMQTKTQTSRKLADDEAFEVGTIYLVRFLSLYRKKNQILSNIYYYTNLVLEDLPSWMQIDRENQSDPNLQTILQIDVPKECLESETSKSSFLILIIKTCLQLSNESFIYNESELQTTSQESIKVYKYLKSNGYINGQNCVTDFFAPTTVQFIPLDDAFKDQPIDVARLDILQGYVNETLKRSIAYNQFIFDVISSLKFNQDTKDEMVIANQDYISIPLSFPANNSPFIFVQKMYPNVIIYFNDEQTILKMEGSRSCINQALSNKIIYFDLSKKQDRSNQDISGEKILSIQIVDNFNYDLSYQLQVPEQVKFFKEKSEIILNIPLQEQVYRAYDSASLFIEVSFLIEFEKSSFIDPDDIPLIYDFQQEINGQFIPISSGSFIKFDNNNLRLVGTPSQSELFTTVRLKLVASNGYTTLYQEFYLKIDQMPFSYIFNKLVQILGPIAFFFGLYRKRSLFMNVYFKKNTMYSTETAYFNQLYRKKITILGYDYEIAHLFFLKYLKTINKTKLKRNSQGQDIIQFQVKQNANNDQSMFSQAERNNIDNYCQTPSNFNQNDHLIISNNNIQSNLHLADIKKRNDDDILSQNSEHVIPQINECVNELQPDLDQIKQISKEKESQGKQPSQIQENKSQQQIPPTKQTQQRKNSHSYQLSSKFLHKLKSLNTNLQSGLKNESKQKIDRQSRNNLYRTDNIDENRKKDYQFIRKAVFNDDYSIEPKQLFRSMLESKLTITYNLQNYSIQNYKTEIENSSSRFYYCLKAVVVRYLMDYDERSQHLYLFLKKYAIQTGEYSQNDWYKLYVEIVATNNIDKYGIPVPFSKTLLNENHFYNIFKDLEIIPDNLDKNNFSYYSSLIEHQINPILLKEVLFADALGLQLVSAKSILKCNGQSLHLENHSIISIEAYKLIEDGNCLCLRRPFSLNYQKLPISKYLSLPSWMAYDCKNGVIVLEGIPSKQDINHILIRIYDSIHFATFQFHLKIEENPNKTKHLFPQQNEDNAYDSLQKYIRSQNKIIQQSLSLQHRQRKMQNNSIFQVVKNIKQKESAIPENYSAERSQNQRENEESDYEQIDEIDNKGIKFEKTMTEFDLGITSPPLFTLSPNMQGIKIIQKQSFNGQQTKQDSHTNNDQEIASPTKQLIKLHKYPNEQVQSIYYDDNSIDLQK